MPCIARILWVFSAALAFLLAGCATTFDVQLDDGHDFSGDRSWDWARRWTRVVESTPGDEMRLDSLTARLVADALTGGGRPRTVGDADLLVAFELDVAREQVAVNETGAVYQLSSHHASPSFLVQSTVKRIETYHTGALRIDVTDRRSGQRVWRGELKTRQRGSLDEALRDSIPQLLSQLAPPAAAPAETIAVVADPLAELR